MGRLSKQKNYELLFEALKDSNYEVDIIGHGNYKIYESIISKNKINVNFLGNVPNSDLPKIYNSYKTFILCSLYEGHPKSLLEAMSCGINCIGTNVQGISELYDNNNFELVDLNSKSLRSKIDYPMLRDSNINFYAAEYINNNFSIPHIKKKYLNLYKKIL